MLHRNVQMVDIDVDHWRNLQDLFLESSKEKRRIIVIHEGGEIQKLVHSDRTPIEKPIERVTSPEADAKAVYEANRSKVDFVMILERRAVEQYMSEIQDSWSPDEDVDDYVSRMYGLLPKYVQGITTYPGSAKENLGLQWRIGASHEEFKSLLKTYAQPETAALLGLVDRGKLWATLVLGLDAEHKIDLITSLPVPTGTPIGTPGEAAEKLLGTLKDRRCSLGLFAELESFRQWIQSENKKTELPRLIEAGKAVLKPAPGQLLGSLR